jgi:pimeloyl-ACP methyl ester carboxylesterase
MASSAARRYASPDHREISRLVRPAGVGLCVERIGHGRPVVFAHGFGQTRQAWGNSADAVARRGYSAITVDGRGHGQSDWNPPALPYSMEQFIDDLGALRATLPAAPVLVGASMGGLLGLMLQGHAPLFAALVLVDVTPRWETRGVERILSFMGAHPDGFASFDEAAEAIAAYLPHRQGRKSPGQLQSLLVPHGDGRLRWHWDPRLLEEVARGAERHQHALLDAASRIDIPTLLVSGGRSDLVSDHTVQEFRALVPHASHVTIAEATHMVAGDRNDLFTDAILAFLDDVAPPAAVTSGASP